MHILFKVGDRVIYTQPKQIHSLFMPPGRSYTGTIVAVCGNSKYVIYRIKLDITWGYIDGTTANVSHVNPRRLDENVVLGNVTPNEIIRKISIDEEANEESKKLFLVTK